MHGLGSLCRNGTVRSAGTSARRRSDVGLYIDPHIQGAREVLVEEKRLGVDVLDAIVVVGCLGTMAIFPERCFVGA